ncbi:MAG: hypothetical protein U5L10_04460 [Candidatus Moranbacteria bacterium]|nr:hypothetical protein [Candidatus Moranbacteria bacterium]
MSDFLEKIYKLKQTVFTVDEIAIITRETNVKAKLAYYEEIGKLKRIRRGIYSIDENYNKYELACKVFTPAYVSFETVLAQEGVIFQYYKSISAASYLSREIECDGQKFKFRKLKRGILSSPEGVIDKDNYFIASKERAFLDMLYVSKSYYFDNPSSLDWDKVFKILPIYDNKRMNREVKEIHKNLIQSQ